MKTLFDNKSIIACSSGLDLNTAISVIRISGFSDLLEFQHLFSKNLSSITPRTMYQANLIDKDEVVDSIMFCYFQAPKSYTGENLLELYAHGNILNTKRIIDLFCQADKMRLALPGEFTYRALKNKKISMTQAEGLDLFLNANNKFMLRQGMDVLQGELHQKFNQIYELFKYLKANFEIQIDFLEDVGEEEADQNLMMAMEQFEKELKSLFNRTLSDRSSLMTPKIAFIGQTNAGKSTLFNEFLGENRAIVSKIKGTTRDYITEYINIDGNNFQLIDTAGIRDTDAEIEQEGINRSKTILQNAFYKILVINPLETNIQELHEMDISKFDHILITHADQTSAHQMLNKLKLISNENLIFTGLVNAGPIEPKNQTGPIEPKKQAGPIEPKKQAGPIEPKKQAGPIEPISKEDAKLLIIKGINAKYQKLTREDPILIDRQRKYIQSSYNKYLKLKETLRETSDIAISLSELSMLENELNLLIGVIPSDDVLDTIFNNFCIGK